MNMSNLFNAVYRNIDNGSLRRIGFKALDLKDARKIASLRKNKQEIIEEVY